MTQGLHALVIFSLVAGCDGSVNSNSCGKQNAAHSIFFLYFNAWSISFILLRSFFLVMMLDKRKRTQSPDYCYFCHFCTVQIFWRLFCSALSLSQGLYLLFILFCHCFPNHKVIRSFHYCWHDTCFTLHFLGNSNYPKPTAENMRPIHRHKWPSQGFYFV